jgi:predicted PurR-regulated permease PerM
MDKIKVPTRDLYLLIIGILLAFLVQVVYEALSEVMTNQINSNWLRTQAVIAVIIGIILLTFIIDLEEEKKVNKS